MLFGSKGDGDIGDDGAAVKVVVNMGIIMLSLIASRVYQQPNSWSPALMARVVAAMMVVVMVAMFMLQNNINYQQRES